MNNKENTNKRFSKNDKSSNFDKSKDRNFPSKPKSSYKPKSDSGSFGTDKSNSKFSEREYDKKSTYSKENTNSRFGDNKTSPSTYSRPFDSKSKFSNRDNSKSPYEKPNQFGKKTGFDSQNKDSRSGFEKRPGQYKPKSFNDNANYSKSYTPKYDSDSKATSADLNDNQWSNLGGKKAKEISKNVDENGFIKRPKRELRERKPSTKLSFEENRRVGPSKPPMVEESRLISKLPPKIKAKVEKEEFEDKSKDIIRLNKYISNAGLCSRREADELIASGQIQVNGSVVTEMGYKVLKTDVVKYGRKILSREKFVYILLNKPKDFITTTEDPEDRKTVMDLLKNACDERIYPIGRLDRMTTGLLLVTNDGELTEKLSHPSNNIKKVYQVELDKPLTNEDYDKIKSGIELEDGMIKADDLAFITPDNEVIGIEIHSGKNRIVRRIFESLGYVVKKLDRTTYAGLTKKDLPRGKWRFLTEKELIRLKYLI